MTKKTKVGIIGLGGIAQLVHLPILSKLNNVEIEAAAEINKSRLKFISDKFSIKYRFNDHKEMLKNTDIEAVIIATPTNTHAEVALECIKANKHVLIEKPIAVNYEEASKINAAAIKHKRLAMVGMNLRFRPDAMLLKSLLSSGELGEIFYIKCSWLRKQSSEQKWFMRKSEAGGGVISDIGIVLIDLSCWLIDYPELKSASVQTYKHRTREVEDSAVGLIRFQNSTVINFEVSWSLHSEQDSMHLTAYGTKGTAQLNPLRAYKRVESARIDFTPATSSSSKNLYKKSYENELKHFIGAVQSTNPLRSSSEDMLTQMKLLSAIYESSEKHCEINLV